MALAASLLFNNHGISRNNKGSHMTAEEGREAIARMKFHLKEEAIDLIQELRCDLATGDTGGYVLNAATWIGYAHERGCLSRNMRIFLVYCSEVHEFLVSSPEQRVEWVASLIQEGEKETLRKGCQEFRDFRGVGIPAQHITDIENYPSLWFACR